MSVFVSSSRNVRAFHILSEDVSPGNEDGSDEEDQLALDLQINGQWMMGKFIESMKTGNSCSYQGISLSKGKESANAAIGYHKQFCRAWVQSMEEQFEDRDEVVDDLLRLAPSEWINCQADEFEGEHDVGIIWAVHDSLERLGRRYSCANILDVRPAFQD